jgi:hypothetical protein
VALHPARAFLRKLLRWLLTKCALTVSLVEGQLHIELSIHGVVVVNYTLPIPLPDERKTAVPRRAGG